MHDADPRVRDTEAERDRHADAAPDTFAVDHPDTSAADRSDTFAADHPDALAADRPDSPVADRTEADRPGAGPDLTDDRGEAVLPDDIDGPDRRDAGGPEADSEWGSADREAANRGWADQEAAAGQDPAGREAAAGRGPADREADLPWAPARPADLDREAGPGHPRETDAPAARPPEDAGEWPAGGTEPSAAEAVDDATDRDADVAAEPGAGQDKVGRAEAELAAAEERGDEPDRAEVERAEAELAAAEDRYSQPVPPQPLPPELVVASSLPLQGAGVAVGTYEGPTVPIGTQAATAPAADAAAAGPVGDLKPGEADTQPVGEVWDDGTRRDLQERWRDIQLRFVDDPGATVGEARTLVDEAVDRYTAALAARRRELESWGDGSPTDTEVLRAALRRYRDFLDTLLS
jgi:hypothetical protein